MCLSGRAASGPLTIGPLPCRGEFRVIEERLGHRCKLRRGGVDQRVRDARDLDQAPARQKANDLLGPGPPEDRIELSADDQNGCANAREPASTGSRSE